MDGDRMIDEYCRERFKENNWIDCIRMVGIV
jgi:hypothetical protein